MIVIVSIRCEQQNIVLLAYLSEMAVGCVRGKAQVVKQRDLD
jgi:hypothetical protein